MKWYTYLTVLLMLSACHGPDERLEGFAYRGQHEEGWGIVAIDGTVILPSGTLPYAPSALVHGRFTLPDSAGYLQLFDVAQPQQPVTRRRFARVGYFFEEVTLAQELPGSPLMLIDRQGQTVKMLHRVGSYEVVWAHNFSEGRALVATSQGKYGYLDTRGEWAVPPVYDRAFDFAEGVALVGTSNMEGEMAYRCINPDGRTVCAIMTSESLLYPPLSDGRLAFRNLSNGQCGYIDRTGLPVVCLPDEVTAVHPLHDGVAVVATQQGKGLMNKEEQWLIPASHPDLRWLGSQRVALRSADGWRLHDAYGEAMSEVCYDTIGQFYAAGKAVARIGGRSAWVPLSGDTTQVMWMETLLEDSEANRLYPQCFSQSAGTPSHQGAAAGTEPLLGQTSAAGTDSRPGQALAAGTEPRPGQAVEARGTTRLQRPSSLRPDEWKRIGEGSPFFEEAKQVAAGKLEEKDAAHRRLILNYVEHLRSAYITKDIDFLEQLFSEQALIIVGTVIRSGETARDYLSPAQVVYNVNNKKEYLRRLRLVFKANLHIELDFSRFRILRHPTIPGIYGVSLLQGYRSDHYSDEGFLFLLWDFRDEAMPQIHVRTWQPVPITPDSLWLENETFGLGDFNLQ